MSRRVLVLLLVLLQVIVLLPRSGSAAETTAESQIRLLELSYPPSVKAGSAVTFRVKVDAAGAGGTCCGSLALRGPNRQYLRVNLRRVDAETLEGSYSLSPHSPTGVWTIRSLTLHANSWAELRVTEGEAFRHSFTVTGSGGAPDTRGPELLSLDLPEQAQLGMGFPITVTARDDLSGIQDGYGYGYAVVELPSQKGGTWRQQVDLRATETAGKLAGHMVMEPTVYSPNGLTVTEIVLYDRAGNYTWLKSQDLQSRQFRTAVQPQDLPLAPGLLTSPFLDLIHPGRLTYTNWRAVDREYLLEQLGRVPGESEAVREHLVAEIAQIRAALDQVRSEVYTDPLTGLRLSPFATTGKWLVLEKAILLRTFLLARTHEPAASFTESARESHQAYLAWEYGSGMADGAKLLPMDGGNNLRHARQAAAYLNLFAHAPEAAAVLQMPADQSYGRVYPTELDRNVIYFMPVEAEKPYYWQPGMGILRIPAKIDEPMHSMVPGLFYQIGLHLGEVLFSASDQEDRDAAWAPYRSLRQGDRWPDGFGGETPGTNLGIDFADTYLPFALGFRPRQAYIPLRDHPVMQKGFREMVTALLENPPPPLAFSDAGTLQVGLENSWSVTVRSPDVRASVVLRAEAYANAANPFTQQSLPFTGTWESLTFISRHVQLGRAFSYTARAVDATGRDHYRYYTHLQAPLLLDPVPTGTNRASIRLTGTTLPGRSVTAGAQYTTADAKGRFALEVPLKPGKNLLRLSVSGIGLGARLTVHASPPNATLPLRITREPAAVTREAHAIVEGKTVPYAVVKVGSLEFQAGAGGGFWAYLHLPARVNTMELVSTDRFGNQVSWTQQIVRDLGPPRLNVHVNPVSSSTRRFLLYTEPGVQVSVNGEPLPVDRDGTASYSVTLGEGESRELLFVAEDPAGNRTEKRYTFSRQEE